MDNVNGDTYKDIGQSEFNSEVIEASKKNLIIVDFWAPWCGPCKTLGPLIEKVVSQSAGKVKLIKINIDENQELAAQLQIQSIPTVYAFKNGRINNAFQGAIPESEIVKFIEKSLGEKLAGNYIELIQKARDFLNEENYHESISLIEEIISNGQQNNEAIEILIRNKIGLKQYDEVKNIIESLDDKALKDRNIKSAIEGYKIFSSSSTSKSESVLVEELKKNPQNMNANKNLSDFYFSQNKYNEAFELLLALYSKSKKEEKENIKKFLFEYFEILGNSHAQTKEARRKLSSIIFS